MFEYQNMKYVHAMFLPCSNSLTMSFIIPWGKQNQQGGSKIFINLGKVVAATHRFQILIKTERSSLNLPFYLHKSLTKMAHQVKVQPTKIAGRLFHHGLIKLIVQELLQRRNITWKYFLFWNEFEIGL